VDGFPVHATTGHKGGISAALFHFIIARLQQFWIYRLFHPLFEACPGASFRDNAIMTNPTNQH